MLGYLKKHSNLGISYYNDLPNSPLGELLSKHNLPHDTTVVFSDSSWQDCVDTGKSTGAFAIFSQGGLVDYASFVPDPVAMSSGEAKYNAGAVAGMATLHMKMLEIDLFYLGTPFENDDKYKLPGSEKISPSLIIFDSECAIKMAETSRSSSRTHHIDRRFHFVRNGQSTRKFLLGWITSNDQQADMGTKGLLPQTLVPLLKVTFVVVKD